MSLTEPGAGAKTWSMCGRFALTARPDDIFEFFGAAGVGDFPPRYNIAPGQPILLVTALRQEQPVGGPSARRALLARWGFIPGWLKNLDGFPLIFNARADTAGQKASFRGAMRHRRILVPASGYYDWRRPPEETGLKGQPYWIFPRDGAITAFGGLMETYLSADGSEIDTVAILTTSANRTINGISQRMPVVIARDNFSRWLDCDSQEPRDVVDLIAPVADDVLEAVPIPDRVNVVSNTGPELQKPIILAAPIDKDPSRKDGQMSLF